MENKKWELKPHYHQIADTGDYDGHWELTNGDISLITRDDLDDFHEDDSYIKVIIEAFNQLGAKWENSDKDTAEYELHLEKQSANSMREYLEKEGLWSHYMSSVLDNIKGI
jgi:hypothetical protein